MNPRGKPPQPDLSSCEQEPIHVPGAIQPHGALLAALADGLLVTHASANLAAILGRPAESVLGRPLAEAIGETACRALLGGPRRDEGEPGHVHFFIGQENNNLDLRAHRTGRHVCVDIEPIRHDPNQRPPVILAQSVLETFKHTSTLSELCDLAVVGLRAITGYDRVMAYRFHEDGHGEVIAEARAARLEPYLGLHYPASDVPPQTRRLYLRQRVGSIANSSYRPVPLLVDPTLDDAAPLDLTHSSLRSASPLHREYMRNMKTAASLTIGLSQESAPEGRKLWGMLVCHNGRPLVAGPELRSVADMIGQVVSLLLGSLGEAEAYAQRLKSQATLRALVDRLAEPVPLAKVFAAAEAELLDLMDAGGVVVHISGAHFSLGRTPAPATVAGTLAVLLPVAAGAVLSVDDLGLRYPELDSCTAEGSGALLLPFAPDADDAILWFRPELSRTIAWGGNPAEHVTSDPATGRLSPRRSFDAWKETVRGRSAPWTECDLALAKEFRHAIEAAVAQRIKAELARLRYYDSLTGLPNRSLLQDKLKQAESEPEVSAALLFLDLDGFKAVNDTMGHATGDALLAEVARRLLAVAGPEAMPTRLGGDEFVVLCRQLDTDAVARLAERIRQAIAAPFGIAGRSVHISASIGIAVDDQSGKLGLVRAADMAMYAAKRGGGNRSVIYEPSQFDHATWQFDLEHDMREALSRGEQFALLYQPLFHIAAGRRCLTGVEALVRWRHPRHGWLSPEQFIPLAEKSGLMLPLGDWILTAAMRQGRMLRQTRPDLALRMAVSVSSSQLLHDGFCSGLCGILEAEGLPPAAVCLEVTDSTLTGAAATSILSALRRLGVQVALDKFGIGTSSLATFRRLPVDLIRLDRSFLEDADTDPGRYGPSGDGFVGAVVALAHAAGMQVVFEGVDTEAQLEIALAAGADVVQGFFFAPPLSASAAEDFVAQHRQLDDRRNLMTPLSR
jgi:diguanylate cyclase (GGDEF)-like protein